MDNAYGTEEIVEKPIDWNALIFKYLAYWKWFVVSIVLLVAIGVVYLKITPKTYEIKATLLLKDDQKGGGTADTDLSALKDMGLFNVKNNVDNELEVLKTNTLAENVVRTLGSYVSYAYKGIFREMPVPIRDTPLKIWLSDNQLDTLSHSLKFQVTRKEGGQLEFSGKYDDNDFVVMVGSTQKYVMMPFGPVNFSVSALPFQNDEILKVVIYPPMQVAQSIQKSMDMDLTSKTTSVVTISMKTTDITSGKTFLNKFVEIYNQQDMEDQNIVTVNTDRFVDARLATLTKELKDVEKQVEDYKEAQGLTDIDAEAQAYIEQTGDLETQRLDVETQLAIVNDIDAYINQKENKQKLLPASTGVKNTDITTQIDAYNKLILERQRLMRTASADNQAMQDISQRISEMYVALQTAVRNEKRSWQIARQDLMKEYDRNSARIRDIPHQEREYIEIKRQQTIKETLYLFLLQKKEENGLNMSSVVPKAKIIDKVRCDGIPVSPKGELLLIIFALAGFILPVGVIRIRETFRYQIESKSELENLASVPVLAEIPHNTRETFVGIEENSVDSTSEMFRLLRSNVLFVLNEQQDKVILVVSGMPGEGKSFMSVNLAISLALLDKKVLLIGLDLRKSNQSEYADMDVEKGVSLYLSGHLDRQKLVQQSTLHPNLSMIVPGQVPPNPNELLAKTALETLIADMKNKFDYIVLDTPPISMVADSLLINRVADITLYVVRAGYTPQKSIEDANRLFAQQKFQRPYLVLNESDTNKRKYGQYYGKYRYNYEYGYGTNGKHHQKETIRFPFLKKVLNNRKKR